MVNKYISKASQKSALLQLKLFYRGDIVIGEPNTTVKINEYKDITPSL